MGGHYITLTESDGICEFQRNSHTEGVKGRPLKGNVMTAKFPTCYMDEALFNLPEVIETAQERLADVDFDTLVGTGFSGGIVIPSLALAMGKEFVLIRKETDDSHHGPGRLLGDLGSRWIFVDDFVSSGRTRARVIRKVGEAAEQQELDTAMVGQYMYVNYSPLGPTFENFQPSWTDIYQ